MKRWMLYVLAAITLLTLRPRDMKDLSGLIPVELLYIYKEGDRVFAETDTGNTGQGRSLEGALKDLERSAPGRIFLETADFLLITEDAAYLLPKLTRVLRPAAEVCIGIGADAQAAAYLKAHRPETSLKDIRAGAGVLPTLIRTGERYYFGQSRKFIWKT